MRLLFAGAVMAALTRLLAAPAAAKPKDYTLVCNGASMSAVFTFHDTRLHGKRTLRVFFAKSPFAASRKAPQAGQCAWVDRPLAASEPSSFVFKDAANPFTKITIADHKSSAAFISPHRIARSPRGGLQGRAGQLVQVLDKISKGQTFYVQVHSEDVNGRKMLVMSRFGP